MRRFCSRTAFSLPSPPCLWAGNQSLFALFAFAFSAISLFTISSLAAPPGSPGDELAPDKLLELIVTGIRANYSQIHTADVRAERVTLRPGISARQRTKTRLPSGGTAIITLEPRVVLHERYIIE